MRVLAALALLLLVELQGSTALKCFVGKGNSSTVLPATQEEMEKHELSQGRERPDFKIVQCDKEGSLLFQFDKIARDVSDKIEAAVSGAVDKVKGEKDDNKNRRKREDKDKDKEDEYACGKLLLLGTAYRSCVYKVGKLVIDCNSALGQYAVCYCQGDNCNGATGMMMATTKTKAGWLAAMLLIPTLARWMVA